MGLGTLNNTEIYILVCTVLASHAFTACVAYGLDERVLRHSRAARPRPKGLLATEGLQCNTILHGREQSLGEAGGVPRGTGETTSLPVRTL
jgi:hypothetical protein